MGFVRLILVGVFTGIYVRKLSYIVSDDLSSHRSITENGVHLLIIDGDFLKAND